MSCINRCANLLKPDLKCHIIGSFTIMISAVLISISIIYLNWEEHKKIELLHKILQSDINKTLMDFVAVMTLIVSFIWITFSIALIIGVVKNYVGLVLCYFVYGIFVVISFNLGALLLLLHQHWIIALVEVISSSGRSSKNRYHHLSR
ncbi:uncharacterized protein ACR2FA_007182 isoform 2-T2 [Aphomia sociella]